MEPPSYMRSVVDRNVVIRRIIYPRWCYSIFVVSPNPVFSVSSSLNDVKPDLRFSPRCWWRRKSCCASLRVSWRVSYEDIGVFNLVCPEGAGSRPLRKARSHTALYIAIIPGDWNLPCTSQDRQCFSTAGPWHQLYRAARGSPGICHFIFQSNFYL